MPLMRMKHEKDPRQVILDSIGDLSGIEIAGNRVLMAIYQRPKQTASGLHLADVTRSEDQYQGKAALVLKMGASAFVSDKNYDFRGFRAEPGDWVLIRVNEGKKLDINHAEGHCRMALDVDIEAKISDPDMVW